jgi:hypothetical protein
LQNSFSPPVLVVINLITIIVSPSGNVYIVLLC